MDSRIPTLFGGIGRDGGRGSPRFEFGNPFCVVGVGLSGPGLGFQMGVYAPLPCGLSAMEKNRIPSAIP